MSATIDRARLAAAHEKAVQALVAAVHPEGYWEGRLSSSALSTATAVTVLCLARCERDAGRIAAGVTWLARTQNADGGWGDTPGSPSNLATALLALSALHLVEKHAPDAIYDSRAPSRDRRRPEEPPQGDGATEPFAAARPRAIGPGTVIRAQGYVLSRAGKKPADRVAAILRIYGEDRTFAVPILTNCALAGLVPWDAVPGLPFEMAALPHSWYRTLNLQVVSYALPALIAIGVLLGRRNPTRQPLLRALRRFVEPAALRKLERIQPEHGGFLDATPLTSFVAMSLLPLFGIWHPVVRRCLGFLRQSQRDDGSWPIDTNLSVWLTTGAVTALAAGGRLHRIDRERTQEWLLERQYHSTHPYTNAAPGGWAWTHCAGGVPDADDTAGALVALSLLKESRAADADLEPAPTAMAPSEPAPQGSEAPPAEVDQPAPEPESPAPQAAAAQPAPEPESPAPQAAAGKPSPKSAGPADMATAERAARALAGENGQLDLAGVMRLLRAAGAVPGLKGDAPEAPGPTNDPAEAAPTDDASEAAPAVGASAPSSGGRREEDAILSAGMCWLLGLQNADGGWPTFCTGWGQLPFDRSSPDITAHALRAVRAVGHENAGRGGDRAIARGLSYLANEQRVDGAWEPLWFGNQFAAGHANPVLGTARVLLALRDVAEGTAIASRGVGYLTVVQNPDGGWGGDRGVSSTVEETALATAALSEWHTVPEAGTSALRGVCYLVERVECGEWTRPAPIGLYFASLWYAEELYPLVWTVEALGRAMANHVL